MTETKAEWEGGKCRVPMWMGGSPDGHCNEPAFGPQYPREVLAEKNPRFLLDRPPYAPPGPCCPAHGGPAEGEPIVFQDGYTEQGRRMWCAVMPGFINLQESPAGFSDDGRKAISHLRNAIAAEKRLHGAALDLLLAAKRMLARWPKDQDENGPLYDEAQALRRAVMKATDDI